MNHVVFIAPAFDSRGPRTIRVSNIIRQLNEAENIEARLIKYENSNVCMFQSSNESVLTNKYNWLHIVFRIATLYRFSASLGRTAKKIGPLAISNFLIKWDLKSRKAELNNQRTILVVVVSPWSNYLLLPWLKEEFDQCRIVLDVGDPLYLNSARDNSDEYSKEVEKSAVTRADTILVTNQPTKDFFINTYQVNGNKIAVVPQGVNLELITATKMTTDKTQQKTLAYAGRFYKGLRWPDSLFKAMASQDKYTLHLYGSGWDKSEINVVQHSKMSHEELFGELHRKEILVFIDNDRGIQTSGKIYELLAFGKPLLFIKGSETSEAEELAKRHANVFFAENNPSSILKALKGYQDQSSLNKVEGPINEYSWRSRSILYRKALKI